MDRYYRFADKVVRPGRAFWHLLSMDGAEIAAAALCGQATEGLLVSDDANAPEWVTYQYRKAYPVLRWLPSKLAEWLAENMQVELAIPAKQDNRFTMAELNSILATVLAPNRDRRHQRTWTTHQWECENYMGRPKARCYPFYLQGHRFPGQNPQVFITQYIP
jgi:hypothetical protein